MSKRTSIHSDKIDTEEQKILFAQEEIDLISLFAADSGNLRQLISENLPSTLEEGDILSSSPLSPILSEFPSDSRSSGNLTLSDQSLSLKKANRKKSEPKIVTLDSEQAVPHHQQQIYKHQSLHPVNFSDSSVITKVPTTTTKEAPVSVIIEEPNKKYSGVRSSSRVSSTTTIQPPQTISSSTIADRIIMVDERPEKKRGQLKSCCLTGLLFYLMCSCCRRRRKDKKEQSSAGPQQLKLKNKRRRNFCLCCIFILIIIILFLLGGFIWLFVHAKASPGLNSSTTNNGTFTNTTNISPNASFCLSSFNALVPSQTESFSCDTCGSDETFYNITQFCVFKGIWANTPNKTALQNLGWMQSKDFCKWFGVICDNSGNTIELDLKDPIIPNVVIDDIGRLKTLRKLIIFGTLTEPSNNFPAGLFNLTNLELLNIQFTGLTNLPDSFDKLTSLKNLTLSQNPNLGKSMPQTIGKLSLTSLIMSGQGFRGNIPDYISNSKALQSSLNVLDLSANNFSGPIPSSLSQFNSLITLNLEVNNLTSQLPDFSAYASAKSIHNLQLDKNSITGQIPTSISALTNLVVLRLQNNQLSGSIPTQIGSMNSLQELDLSHNGLTGNIPDSVASLKTPKINLSANSLSGTIPASMCQNNYDLCNLSSNNFTNSGKCGVCLT